MRMIIMAAAALALAACGAEEQPPSTAQYTIVHTCKNGREIYKDNNDQELMIWGGSGFWIPVDQTATIEGICGEADAPSDNPAPVMVDDQYSTTP